MKRLRLRWELATEFYLFTWVPGERQCWSASNFSLTPADLWRCWISLRRYQKRGNRHFRFFYWKQVYGRDWACVYSELVGGTPYRATQQDLARVKGVRLHG